MKIKSTFLLCLVLSLFMVSCGEGSKSESQLDGTWEAFEFSGAVSTSTASNGSELLSETNITGSNIDYTLVLSDGNFTTNGSYDVELDVQLDGMQFTSSTDNYTNISGNGTYSETETEIIVDGQFFELTIQGMPATSSSGPVTSPFVIVDDVLTFIQNEVTTTEQFGLTSTTNFTFESKWRKK